MEPAQENEAYWQKNLRMTGLLLAVWFVVTFVVAFFARDLSFSFLGWPFSFWMGAQGALFIYVGITCWYAHYMDKLDRQYGMHQDD